MSIFINTITWTSHFFTRKNQPTPPKGRGWLIKLLVIVSDKLPQSVNFIILLQSVISVETSVSRHHGDQLRSSWKPPNHQSTIVLRGKREALNWDHIMPRDASVSENVCNFYSLMNAYFPIVVFTLVILHNQMQISIHTKLDIDLIIIFTFFRIINTEFIY